MTFQPGANLYTQGFGSRPETIEVPELQTRAPASTDVRPVGKTWIDTLGGAMYVCSSQTSGPTGTASTWIFLGAADGDLNTITTQDSTIVIPSAGNIDLVGSGSIATTGSGDTATVALTGLTNHAVLVGAGTATVTKLAVGSNGQVLLGSTSADPAFGTLTTSTGLAFTLGAHSLAIDVKSGGYAVTAVAGASQAMSSQTTYIANDSALTTFTLPTTSAVGDVINVVGSALNTGGWKITYTTGQIIWGPGGSSTVTTGNAASAAAAAQTCSIMCVVANTTWVIFANSGTITLT